MALSVASGLLPNAVRYRSQPPQLTRATNLIVMNDNDREKRPAYFFKKVYQDYHCQRFGLCWQLKTLDKSRHARRPGKIKSNKETLKASRLLPVIHSVHAKFSFQPSVFASGSATTEAEKNAMSTFGSLHCGVVIDLSRACVCIPKTASLVSHIREC